LEEILEARKAIIQCMCWKIGGISDSTALRIAVSTIEDETRDLVLDDTCTGSPNWDQHEQDLLFEISSHLRAPQWQGA
jgi:hypothetical protein